MDVRRFILICAVAALSTVLARDVTNASLVEIIQAPAPNVVGHTSFTFRVNLDPGKEVISIIGDFRAPNMDMHQVHRPGDLPTFTNDFEGSFTAPFTNEDDSQFDFSIFEWNSSLQDMDTSSELIALYLDPAVPDADPFAIAHVVIPSASFGTYDITVNYVDNIENPPDNFVGVFAVPEASQVLAGTVLTLAALGFYVIRRRQSKSAAPA